MMKYILSVLAVLSAMVSPAQERGLCLIQGNLRNTSMVNDILLTVDKRYETGGVDKYLSEVSDATGFSFLIRIDRPQIVKLVYARNIAELYIEPNDTLIVSGDANAFPKRLSFSGKGAHNNEYYRQYQTEFPEDSNEFTATQYRSGLYWFHVPPKLDGMMQRMSQNSYAESMAARRNARRASLMDYRTAHPGMLSPQFIEYMEAGIEYEYGYYMLCYGDIFRNKHLVRPAFLEKATTPPIINGQLGQPYYREYLKAFINHEHMEINGNNVVNIISKQYHLAPNYLSGEQLAYFRSDIIARALYGKKMDEVLGVYKDFQFNNTYHNYNDKISLAYQKVLKYHTGSPAPGFRLPAGDGAFVDLADYRGRPVFLNFWATWCHPCLKKMDAMKELQREMEEKGMVFLNVSFDGNPKIWAAKVAEKDYSGTHVILTEGVESRIATDYNVRALPQYFLIDKNGNFAEKPPGGDLHEMREIMEGLLK